MTVNKITTAPTSNEVTDKINEIIDNLGGLIVDQSYDPTSSNAQSGVAIAGAGFLQNTATGTNALTVDGTASTYGGSVNIGYGSSIGAMGGVALGYQAFATGYGSTSIGGRAETTAASAIQIGAGTNSTANSLSIGFSDAESNYELLDGTTGLIPYQRIDSITDNNAGGQLKTWTGTKAQYDAIVTKDANTLYNITDDADVTLSLLELLFPVGAVYFGTMSVCPLQTLGVGTWQALPQDKVIQIAGTRGSVNTTVNERLPNITGDTSVGRSGTLCWQVKNASGAFYNTGSFGGITETSSSSSTVSGLGFDASLSSSTYQDNAPVQQDAYLLNGWRRIA